MSKVLQIVESFYLGGAVRAAVALAKYSRARGYEHSLVALGGEPAGPELKRLCQEAQVSLHSAEEGRLNALIEAADIVQLNWWNNPQLDSFVRSSIPAARLLGWFHIGGQAAPQVITPQAIEYFDIAVACSPYTLEASAFKELPLERCDQKVGLVYGAADFARLQHYKPKPHSGFNVGFIGSVSFQKMHPNFVRMSAIAGLDDAQFLLYGYGGNEREVLAQAQAVGLGERLQFRGYVNDVAAALSEFDVFGYPLCPDTYAASEVILQEVMYCGIPVVAFPHGGVRRLITHQQTGLLVNSEDEYARALQYLHRNPDERQRLGRKAAEYARKVFGAENAARDMSVFYERLLLQKKRDRCWSCASDALHDPLRLEHIRWNAPRSSSGAERFVASLGAAGRCFQDSMLAEDLAVIIRSEREIAACSLLMREGGLLPYLRAYRDDKYLSLWCGLAELGGGDAQHAVGHLSRALLLGFSHWRVLEYLALAARKAGALELAEQCESTIKQQVAAGASAI